jgi:hypothetical protein
MEPRSFVSRRWSPSASQGVDAWTKTLQQRSDHHGEKNHATKASHQEGQPKCPHRAIDGKDVVGHAVPPLSSSATLKSFLKAILENLDLQKAMQEEISTFSELKVHGPGMSPWRAEIN